MASAEEGQFIVVRTVDEWTQQLEKANKSKKLLVVDFTASLRGPCEFIALLFAEMARKNPEATFVKVFADEPKCVTEYMVVEPMPSFVLFKEGNILYRSIGVTMFYELEQAIKKHATPAVVIANA